MKKFQFWWLRTLHLQWLATSHIWLKQTKLVADVRQEGLAEHIQKDFFKTFQAVTHKVSVWTLHIYLTLKTLRYTGHFSAKF